MEARQMKVQAILPVAIVCSDLHFSHKSPVARSEKGPLWYDVMEGYCKQLKRETFRLGGNRHTRLPIICAGDILDRWNPPPELLNFLIRVMPVMYAVPGNHDLEYGSYENIRRTGYWTLVEAGKIVNLRPDETMTIGPGESEKIVLHGFPCGFPLKPCQRQDRDGKIHLAVVHDYIWLEPNVAYPGAPEEKRFGPLYRSGALGGYDAAVFGDNHRGHLIQHPDGLNLLNCGTFIRRKSDEQSYKPVIGILYSDGSIKQHFLDTSEDQFEDLKKDVPGIGAVDLEDFLTAVQATEDVIIDFAEAMKRTVASQAMSDNLRKVLLEALEEGLK